MSYLDLRPLYRISITVAGTKFLFDSNDFPVLPEWDDELNLKWNDGIQLRENREIVFTLLQNRKNSNDLIRALQNNPCPAPVAIIENYFDEQWFEVINAPVSSWKQFDQSIQFFCNSGNILETDKLVCRDLSLLPSNPGISKPTWLPVVFGDAEAVECVPLFLSETITTIGSVDPDDIEVLTSKVPASWPDQGMIQLNDEVISYSQKQIQPPGFVGLTRLSPLQHPERSQIKLLPSTRLKWIACDHECVVTEVRSIADDGDVLSEYEVVQQSIGGRISTVIERDLFPLFSNLETFSVPFQISGIANDWDILSETNALTPRDAFLLQTTREQGGRLSLNAPTLQARLLLDISKSVSRFDHIEKVELVFDVQSNNLWGETQSVLATVSWNGNSASARILRDDVIQPVVQINGANIQVDEADKSNQFITSKTETNFHQLNNLSKLVWQDWKELFNRQENTFASLTATPSNQNDATLFFKLTDLPPLSSDTFHKLEFKLRGRSDSQSKKIRMEVILPNYVQQEIEFDLGTELETYSLSIDGESTPAQTLIQADTVFRIYVLEEGVFEVSSVWCELTEHINVPNLVSQKSISIPKQTAVVAETPSELRLDITHLLNTEFPWQIFDGSSDAVEVRFDLETEEPDFKATIKRVRFESQIKPAKDIQLVSNLFADVQGLNRGSDGYANPIDVISELIQSPLFLGRGNSIDLDKISELRNELESAGIKFQTTFQSKFTLENALEKALSESLSWVRVCYSNENIRYDIRRLQTSPDQDQLVSVPLKNIFKEERCQAYSFPRICSGILEFRDSRTRALISTFALGNTGDEPFVWPTLWVKKGVLTLAEAARALFGTLQESIEQHVAPSPITHNIGEFKSIPGYKNSLIPNRTSYLIQQTLKNGKVQQRFKLLPEEEIIWQDGDALIRARRFPSLISFEIEGKVVATFDDHNRFSFAGKIIEYSNFTSDQEGLYYQTATKSIIGFVNNSIHSISIKIDHDGNIFTSNSVSNQSPSIEGGIGLNTSESVIEVSSLTGITILKLDSNTQEIILFGSIRENMVL